MIDIEKTRMQSQTLRTPQEKKNRETLQAEKETSAPEKGVAVEVSLSLKAKMVEVLLTVRAEAKTGLATQAGVSLRAGEDEGKGFDPATLLYNGKTLAELKPAEAQELIAEDGYFGVKKTAQRIADFVLAGGADNLDRLQAGRDGVLQGFAEAEKAWGGKLPEISYQTLSRTLELIDARIAELGGEA